MIPRSQYVEVTHTAIFTAIVAGVGSENLIYQWSHNENIIAGETDDTLVITNLTLNDSGVYMCIVINQYGQNDSSSASLVVTGMYIRTYIHMYVNTEQSSKAKFISCMYITNAL